MQTSGLLGAETSMRLRAPQMPPQMTPRVPAHHVDAQYLQVGTYPPSPYPILSNGSLGKGAFRCQQRFKARQAKSGHDERQPRSRSLWLWRAIYLTTFRMK
jgi:hypothetical protein